MSEKKGLVQEFKEFIATGDLMSVAVAFIMGLAIKNVIDSFVKDIFTGTVGLFVKCTDILDAAGVATGKQDCSGIAGKAYKSVLWGSFLNQVVSFLLTAVVVFAIVKLYRSMVKPAPEPEAGPSDNDLLKDILQTLKADK